MGDLIGIEDIRGAKAPHCSGPARCLACDHEWMAIVPLPFPLPPDNWLECPKCGLSKATIAPFAPSSPVLTCSCGNKLFYATKAVNFCPICAQTYER